MRSYARVTLSLLVVSFSVLSCHKDNGIPIIPPPINPGVLNINLTYPSTAIAAQTFELIISETGGKILLDTTSSYDTPVKASLKTNEKLVDLTTIYLSNSSGKYVITTYKAVDPTGWSSTTVDGLSAADTAVHIPASIVYTHLPSFEQDYIFSDYGAGGDFSTYDPSTSSLSVQYTRYAKNYAYFLLPAAGLYNFHFPTSNADTVDLTHMDTAVKVHYTKPAQYTISVSLLTGIMDTTDPSQAITLYGFANAASVGADLVYPPKHVQKYDLLVNAANANNGTVTFYNYGYTIPTTLPFADETYYNMTSAQNNNFSVSFAAAPAKPNYQETLWRSAKIYWLLYASPDSTTLHPLSLLTSLNSKLLQGQDLSGITLSSLTFRNEPEYTSYAAWLLNACKPVPFTAIKSKTYTLFSKAY